MTKKILALLLCIVMVLTVGCGGKDTTNETTETTDATEGEETAEAEKITFLNSKGEIQTQLEEMAKSFAADTGIEVEIVPCPAGQSPFEKMTAMYASGNAPSLSMMDVGDLPKFKDKVLDLSSEKWVNDAMAGSLEVATIDNQLLAFPFAVEGFGLIYNKEAIEGATGEAFDPAAVKTREDLKTLFGKIQKGGIAPVTVSPMDWSLAAHYSSIAYASKGKDLTGINGVMDSLKKGELDLDADDTFNALFDTFDILVENNKDKADPLAGTYDTGAEAVATGKSGFWFMGNWAWPSIKELSGGKGTFGFIPVPIDVNGESNKLCVGPTKYVAVDKEQNSEAQQKAALQFLNWIVYEENGQKGLVQTCSIIPAFKNITISPDDALAQSIMEYMSKGEFIPMVLTFPSDYWKEVGAYMQKYLSGYEKRDALYTEIETYWKNVK